MNPQAGIVGAVRNLIIGSSGIAQRQRVKVLVYRIDALGTAARCAGRV